MINFKDNFYSQIVPFKKFSEVHLESNYVNAPADWSVIISDIQGSTTVIKEGRYKIVNMVGASTIAAIVNVLGSKEIPFVFGGDGSTALVPNADLYRLLPALLQTQQIALNKYKLNLRIGIVPTAALFAENFKVQAARFAISESMSLAFLKGDGLVIAEEWVKSGKYLVDPKFALPLAYEVLEGLSCRWSPLQNKNGHILTVIIKFLNKDSKVLNQITAELNSVIKFDSPLINPISQMGLKTENILKVAFIEMKSRILGSSIKNYFKALFITTVAWAMNLKLIKPKTFNFDDYKRTTVENSDFKKFDDNMRMVIDVSTEIKTKIISVLEAHQAKKELIYGIHESESALLTCFVQNYKTEHIHFVDGSDGGYAMAALQLKNKIKELNKV